MNTLGYVYEQGHEIPVLKEAEVVVVLSLDEAVPCGNESSTRLRKQAVQHSRSAKQSNSGRIFFIVKSPLG